MGWLTMDVAIEGGIFLSGGVLATLYGYGVLSFTSDKSQLSEQTLKTLRLFRWGGPVLLCLAGSLLLEAYLR